MKIVEEDSGSSLDGSFFDSSYFNSKTKPTSIEQKISTNTEAENPQILNSIPQYNKKSLMLRSCDKLFNFLHAKGYTNIVKLIDSDIKSETIK